MWQVRKVRFSEFLQLLFFIAVPLLLLSLPLLGFLLHFFFVRNLVGQERLLVIQDELAPPDVLVGEVHTDVDVGIEVLVSKPVHRVTHLPKMLQSAKEALDRDPQLLEVVLKGDVSRCRSSWDKDAAHGWSIGVRSLIAVVAQHGPPLVVVSGAIV